MKKLLAFFILAFFIVVAGTAVVVWQKVESIENTRLNLMQDMEFEVKSGSNLHTVKTQLESYASIDDIGFKVWVKLNPQYTSIKTGLYHIPANSQLVDVFAILADGKVKQFSVTLVEGHTIAQWLAALASHEQLNYDIQETSNIYDSLVNAESFCANQYKSIEGCLLPNTYFFTQNTMVSEILKRSYSSMQAYLEEMWSSRFLDVPLQNQYQALILASIIEKETAIESERTEIAGVFVNRLDKNMRLQTDPTVIYGIGANYDGNITRKHLRTATPYNTYVIKGLPITPIAMPSKASINAALMPALTDALYFVATGDGGHQFSTNLADHNKAVRQYLQNMKTK